jgi:betaine-aldehyde dehydrogenase
MHTKRGVVDTKLNFPGGRGLYYGGAWHVPKRNKARDIFNPATGECLTTIFDASNEDVAAAVAAAKRGFEEWRRISPVERGRLIRHLAGIVRKNAKELALIDASDCGNPIAHLTMDVEVAAQSLEFFAGLVTEMKGSSVPQGADALSFSVREPYGVVVRLAPFNHPLLFSVAKAAAPLAAGNSIIIKPPEQAPLSALRIAELFDGILPPGVFNVLVGDRTLGAALVSDPGVSMVGLVGSIPTGRAVMRAASDSLKRVIFELGGKNALIALPDSNPNEIAAAIVGGMNFSWCGQSCGSTSRAFVHEDIYEEVVSNLATHAAKFCPGLPTDFNTTMGCLINKNALDRVKDYIDAGLSDGARLIYGGTQPDDPLLANGYFMLPTIFVDVTMDMRIAKEEIFGPVLSIIKWRDEEEMLRLVNQVDYGLTCAVWTRDVAKAHRIVSQVEAGFCWINDTSRHIQGSPFGGYKQSGIGREECLEELLAFTQEKNVYINFNN